MVRTLAFRMRHIRTEPSTGGVGNTVISSYSGAMFVVGGSGMTFALSAAHELVRSGNSSDVTEIDIVWSIADPGSSLPFSFLSTSRSHCALYIGSLTPMIPFFTALIAQSTAARLRVSVLYTRASTYALDGLYLPPGITLAPGRPDVGRHLDVLVSATRCAGGYSGVFIGVCGPVGLAANVREAVSAFDTRLGRAVGGVEVHEE